MFRLIEITSLSLDCIDFKAIKDYIERLSPDEICEMFPRLSLTDIHWDEDLESTVISVSDDTSSAGAGGTVGKGGKAFKKRILF